MKLMRTLAVSSLATMMSACAGPSSAAPSSPSGGESGGGGNTAGAQAVTKEQVSIAISQAQSLMPYIFNDLSESYLPGSSIDAAELKAYYKLFGHRGEEAPVQEALKRMTVKTPSSGACVSSLGEEDGAAFKDGSICLSLERLQAKTNSENVFVKVASLMVREASHLAGLNEEEATIFQRKAERNIKPNLGDLGPQWLGAGAFFVAGHLEGALDDAMDLIKAGGSASEICLALGELPAKVNEIDSAGFGGMNQGAKPLSREQHEYFIDASRFKVGFTAYQACATPHSKDWPELQKILAVFGKRNRISIEEAMAPGCEGSYGWVCERHAPISDFYVRKFGSEDRQALLEELAEMKEFNHRLMEIFRAGQNLEIKRGGH